MEVKNLETIEKLSGKCSSKNIGIEDIRRVQKISKHLTISTESFLKEKSEDIKLEERKFLKKSLKPIVIKTDLTLPVSDDWNLE